MDRESSIGLAGVLGGFRGRDSAGSNTSSSSNGGGSLKKTSVTKGRSKTPAVTTNTTNGSRAKRQSIDFGGSGSGSSSSVGGVGGSSNSYGRGSAVVAKGKMGPWLSRPGETAICAEEGYDPLDLIHDANKELFGNDKFRGVQEDVRFL